MAISAPFDTILVHLIIANTKIPWSIVRVLFLKLPQAQCTIVNYVAATGIFRLATPGDLAEILQQRRFVGIIDKEFLAELRFSSVEEYYQSLMDIAAPIQNLFAKLSNAQKTEARGRIVASANQYCKVDRVALPMAVRMIAACKPG